MTNKQPERRAKITKAIRTARKRKQSLQILKHDTIKNQFARLIIDDLQAAHPLLPYYLATNRI